MSQLIMNHFISAILGWSYFLCWSFSFYPQLLLNFKKKSSKGVSIHFIIMNSIGFFAYTLYTIKSDHLISQSDIVFACHALLLSLFVYIQYCYYEGFQIHYFITLVVSIVVVQCLTSDYLGYIKVFISVLKYLPQLYQNYQRQSTKGYSTIAVVLDVNGGILSIGQLCFDGMVLHLSFKEIITSNFAKLGLGTVSLVMDTLLLIQIARYKERNDYLVLK